LRATIATYIGLETVKVAALTAAGILLLTV
jgi:hypothetical protein